jgi:NADPH-dependent 2,4-dienoyl-CoA reductase/sulfur reductase-like enzyme
MRPAGDPRDGDIVVPIDRRGGAAPAPAPQATRLGGDASHASGLAHDAASDLHRIVVIGGGAGGLELATGLGDKLGRRQRALVTLIDRSRTHLWKPLLHEVAAGSMDFAVHELHYMAQSHWHGFRLRLGEMIGPDRTRRLVHVAPFVDEDGTEVTPRRTFGYDTLVIAVGSHTKTSARRACRRTRSAWRRPSTPRGFTACSCMPASGRTRSRGRSARSS